MDTKDLDASQLQELEALVSDFQDTFSTGRQDVGRTNMTHHQNDTGDAPPPSSRLLTDIPIHRPQEVEHLINEIQEQGITQPSQSPWPSLSCQCKKKLHSFLHGLQEIQQSHKERLIPITQGRQPTRLTSRATVVCKTGSGQWILAIRSPPSTSGKDRLHH